MTADVLKLVLLDSEFGPGLDRNVLKVTQDGSGSVCGERDIFVLGKRPSAV